MCEHERGSPPYPPEDLMSTLLDMRPPILDWFYTCEYYGAGFEYLAMRHLGRRELVAPRGTCQAVAVAQVVCDRLTQSVALDTPAVRQGDAASMHILHMQNAYARARGLTSFEAPSTSLCS